MKFPRFYPVGMFDQVSLHEWLLLPTCNLGDNVVRHRNNNSGNCIFANFPQMIFLIKISFSFSLQYFLMYGEPVIVPLYI